MTEALPKGNSMYSRLRFIIMGGLLCVVLPGSLWADTTYTYTGNSLSTAQGAFQVTITLDTTLMGAALQDLPANTNISADLGPSFAINPNGWPNQDTGGFPIGGAFGSAYYLMTGSPVVLIGTDSMGNITSWNITQTLFASYPAVPGEDPNDFFATYTISSTTGGDQGTLTLDNDAGFAPPSTSLVPAGTWSPVVVPEPSSFLLAGGGLLVILALRRLRRRQPHEALR